ncbi:MAG: Peptidyl-prolyl cis-trans isomerase A [Burkholderia gladioli]|nr:MAG: Peptidyl-prolyl cis-trans isomerase A [Burkholderia gladioli]
MKRLLLALGSAALVATAPAYAQTTAAHPVVQLKTSQGGIRVELYPEKAPKTVANFDEKPTRAAIPLESRNGLKNVAGTIAMARTSDPNSAKAQFFINTVDNANLDYPNPDGNGYAVFGKVVSGMDVVKKIEATPTTSRGSMRDVPAKPITIDSASVVGK